MSQTPSTSPRAQRVLVLLAFLVFGLFLGSQLIKMIGGGRSSSSLHVYCAAGMRLPLEEAVAAYREETGTEIILEHGSSGELENKILIGTQSGASRADIYIPADRSFTDRAASKGLTAEAFPLAHFKVVVVSEQTARRDELEQLDLYCRTSGVQFIEASVSGCTARVLTDFGEAFTVLDPSSEEVQDVLIQSIVLEENGRTLIKLIEGQ